MKTKKTYRTLLALFMSFLIAMPLYAQKDKKDKSYEQIEKTQDQIEDAYIQIYGIMENYPDALYEYDYENGELAGVTIHNIPDLNDRQALEMYLLDLRKMKEDIYNLSNRMGIYYAAEKEPAPKNGYQDFYENLRGLLDYPETAEDLGVEGTVYVKFIVNPDGEINNIFASENIETDSEWAVGSMKKEAMRAVQATSGNWVPGSIAGVPVSHWVVIPVQFKLDDLYYRPLFGAND